MAKRTKSYGLNNPLQDVFPVPVVGQRAPTANDTNYEIGQVWVDQTTSQIYGLASVASGAATWSILGPGASDVDTLTGDTGGAISPAAGNINILGGDGLTVAGSGSTLTINRDAEGGFPITPFVVGPSGEAGYTTIQAALDDANAAGSGLVFVQPGTYTEDLTFYDGIDLFGSSEQGTIIVGTHTPPTSGTLNIFRCTFQDATAIFSSAAAGTTDIIVEDCTLAVTNGFSFDLLNWTGSVALFDIGNGGTNDGGIRNTAGAEFFLFAAGFGNGSGQTMILSGLVDITTGDISCPIDFQTGATGNISACIFDQPHTLSNNSAINYYNSSFITGASAAITMSSSGSCSLTSCGINSSNNPAIAGSGAGTLTLTGVDFVDNSNIAGTLTLGAGDSITGNLVLPTAASQLQVEGGAATDFIGQATLVAGTVTVANTNIAATDKVIVTREGVGASTALGVLDVSITASTSFTITALQPGTPGSTETNDVSVVNYFIVRQL